MKIVILDIYMINKDTIQQEALEAFVNAGGIGTIELFTGAGKTRLGAMIYDHYLPIKTLVVTSKVTLLSQ